jgi:ubiquinone/menaquinone biosynthesis C-methylase UbiE
MSTSPPGEKPSSHANPSQFYIIQTKTGWQRILRSFANWIAPQPGWRVLDAGCGAGIFPTMLTSLGCQAFGIDLDPGAFLPNPLHSALAVADVADLPFADKTFDLITASNLLFLLPDPTEILREFTRLIHPQGQLALLNPSEHLNLRDAALLADHRGLDHVSRDSLLNWAALAEKHARWDQASLEWLFQTAGLRLVETTLHVGPGFARYARARLLS